MSRWTLEYIQDRRPHIDDVFRATVNRHSHQAWASPSVSVVEHDVDIKNISGATLSPNITDGAKRVLQKYKSGLKGRS